MSLPLPHLTWVLNVVIEDYAKFDLLLKLKRGIKEEKYRVEVNMNIEGKFYLSQFEQDHS